MLVRLYLVSGLGFGDLLSELGVKFVEVDSVVASSSGGEVPLGVDGDGGVVALVREERGYTGGCGWGIVVRELRQGKELGPVVLLVVRIDPVMRMLPA